MSQPFQGNQYFTNVQNASSLSVQNLNVDNLEASNLLSNNITATTVDTTNVDTINLSASTQLNFFNTGFVVQHDATTSATLLDIVNVLIYYGLLPAGSN